MESLPCSVISPAGFISDRHRLIHLDLKGAPPKISYMRELFPVLREYGATGLLVEYEDTFPYHGPLKHLRRRPQPQYAPEGAAAAANESSIVDSVNPMETESSAQPEASKNSPARTGSPPEEISENRDISGDAQKPAGNLTDVSSSSELPYYTVEEVVELLALAAANDLVVIPLVQTFGHVEFLLKHRPHRHLRESVMHPNALCPRHPESMALVQQCVQQLMDAHPDVEHLHLGMDEVLLGACERCKGTSRERVYLEWAVKVCGWVKETYPHLTPIIWDDMLRNISLQDLQASGIGSVTDVMVWKYDAGILQLPEGFLSRLSTVFSSSGVWFASAYKGATGTAQCLVPAQHHVDNHLSWINVIREHGHSFPNFKGFALTGWQRYDHFSILCELLPAAVPCLLLCLKVLLEAAFTSSVHVEVSERLGFQQLVCLSPLPRPMLVEDNLNFPGHGLFSALQMWANFCSTYSVHKNSEIVSGWYHRYRRRQRFVSPGVLEVVRPQCHLLLQSITELRHRLRHELLVVFDPHTTHEWLDCFVQPLLEKLSRDWEECLALQRYDMAACDAPGMGPCTCSDHAPAS